MPIKNSQANSKLMRTITEESLLFNLRASLERFKLTSLRVFWINRKSKLLLSNKCRNKWEDPVSSFTLSRNISNLKTKNGNTMPSQRSWMVKIFSILLTLTSKESWNFWNLSKKISSCQRKSSLTIRRNSKMRYQNKSETQSMTKGFPANSKITEQSLKEGSPSPI